jgi:cystathionine beta-lyase family protein involved in aluminum resistance
MGNKLKNNFEYLKEKFHISDKILNLSEKIEQNLSEKFAKIVEITEFNQLKVLTSFRKFKVSQRNFASTSGYGYGDYGRDTLDEVYADIFGAEDALVRHNIVSGTHALKLCLFAALRPGDTLISVTGTPYDTLHDVIGITGDTGCGSLRDFGVNYRQIELAENGEPDYDKISRQMAKIKPKAALIQRSRGYSFKPSISIEKIEKIIKVIKAASLKTIAIVDNSYGEFVEKMEPTEVGADLAAGSLIKNLGGGIAETGAYVVGRRDLVESAANVLTAPGIGKHVGASLGFNKPMYQGLFMAPHVVSEAVKSATFAATLFSELGFKVSPEVSDVRTDIVEAIELGSSERLVAFCQAIQSFAAIDSDLKLEAWDMPGYSDKIIMASGSFTEGSSIELSADAPLISPYIAYLQGGLIYEAAKPAIMAAADAVLEC